MKSLVALAIGLFVGMLMSGAVLAGVVPLLPETLRNSTTLWASSGFIVLITAWAFWAMAGGRAKP